MKTIEVNLYKFSELSDEAKEKAIQRLSDINVDYNWYPYEDATNINLHINSFDIERGSYVDAKFITNPANCAESILSEHGKDCETYKTAKQFLDDLNELTSKFEDIEDCPEDDIEELEDEFLKSICEDYRIMLQNEYEYLSSEKAIIETIEANDYDFLENGELN